jgi:cytochrome c2
MLSARNRVALAAAGAASLVIVAGGAIYEKIDYRQRMRAHAAAITGGDPERGEAQFIRYGCGGCHALEHVPRAVGGVGPALDTVALQAVVGGRLNNTPDNMRLWIRDPQVVSPGSVMPDLGVTDRDARDISAFLYARPN